MIDLVIVDSSMYGPKVAKPFVDSGKAVVLAFKEEGGKVKFRNIADWTLMEEPRKGGLRLVLYHQSDREMYEGLRLAKEANVSLWYSVRGTTETYIEALGENGILSRPLIDGFLTVEEAMAILAWAEAYAGDRNSPRPAVLRRESPERRDFMVTLSILCQGYLAAKTLQDVVVRNFEGKAAEAVDKMGWWTVDSAVRERIEANGRTAGLSDVDGPMWWLEALGGEEIGIAEGKALIDSLRREIETGGGASFTTGRGADKVLKWLSGEAAEIDPDDVGDAYFDIAAALEKLGKAG